MVRGDPDGFCGAAGDPSEGRGSDVLLATVMEEAVLSGEPGIVAPSAPCTSAAAPWHRQQSPVAPIPVGHDWLVCEDPDVLGSTAPDATQADRRSHSRLKLVMHGP